MDMHILFPHLASHWGEGVMTKSSQTFLPHFQDCLTAFTMTENLEGGDSYKCEGCKKCQPHTKRLQIYRHPRVMVLTLKRFTQRQVRKGPTDAHQQRYRRKACLRAEGCIVLRLTTTRKGIAPHIVFRHTDSYVSQSTPPGIPLLLKGLLFNLLEVQILIQELNCRRSRGVENVDILRYGVFHCILVYIFR